MMMGFGLRRLMLNRSYTSSSHSWVRMPFVFQEIQRCVSFCETNIEYGITRATYVEDLFRVLPPVSLLQKLFRGATIKTNFKSHQSHLLLKQRLEHLMECNSTIEDFLLHRNPTTLVLMLFRYGFATDVPSPPKCRQLHGLAIKIGMLEDEWSHCRIMARYAVEGCSVESIESIFRGSKTKGIRMYNQMISVHSKHFPEDAERLFFEMIKTVRPNADTFRSLLEGWSIACKPEKTLQVLQSMQIYGIQAKSVHYGAVIDAYARMRTGHHIQVAIFLVKNLPIAQGEYAFNVILNRCVPDIFMKEDKKKIQDIIKQAQDLVDYLDEKGFRYGVLEKTHWRLEAREA